MRVDVMSDEDLRNLLRGNIERNQRAPRCSKCRRFLIPGDKVFLIARGDKVRYHHVDCWQHRSN